MATEVPELYSWQHEVWSQIVNTQERLGHATLFVGAEGIGRSRFVSRLAVFLLCSSEENKPCGTCINCSLFSASTHPDLHVVCSEIEFENLDTSLLPYAERYDERKDTQQKSRNLRSNILISQSRALIDEANSHSKISKNKVFIINPVESLTIGAANALLKILEEPAENNFWLLIASDIQNLLPTISSRCQKIDFQPVSAEESSKWLEKESVSVNEIKLSLSLFSGQPLLAKRYIESKVLMNAVDSAEQILSLAQSRSGDVTAVAEVASSLGEGEFLLNIQRLLMDLVRLSTTGNSKQIFFDNLRKELYSLSQKFEQKNLFDAIDQVGTLRFQLEDGSLDKKLAVEDALLTVQKLNSEYS